VALHPCRARSRAVGPEAIPWPEADRKLVGSRRRAILRIRRGWKGRDSLAASGLKLRNEPRAKSTRAGSDDELIVTLPGSFYSVTYYKLPRSRQLLAKRFPMKDDPRVAMTVSEFLIRAWRAANDKARELGWIV
jgi:hypothetical protein